MYIIVLALISVFVLIGLAFFIALKSETNEKNSVFGGLDMVLFLVTMPNMANDKKGNLKRRKIADISDGTGVANFCI
jgi:competence protein ComGC